MTLIFASSTPPASWFLWEALICVAAGIGGFVVLAGLNMEGPPKGEGLRAVRGWRVLRLGIMIEILAAIAFAAKDGWQAWETQNELSRNNPLNRPISDMSAFAAITVEGKDDVRTPEMVKWQNGSVAQVMLYEVGNPKTFSPFEGLDADKYELGGTGLYPTARTYFLQFHRSVFVGASSIGQPKMEANRLTNVESVGVLVNFLPPGSQILTGRVEVVVNSTISRQFAILPQRDSSPENGKLMYWIMASNASPATVIQR